MKYLMPVLALCLFFAPAAWASDANVVLEAGPLWSQADAEQKCPQTAAEWQQANQDYQARWTGQWWTTVQGAMSVCELLVSPKAGAASAPEAGFDAEAGPLWNQGHAEERCRELTEEWKNTNPAYEARWSGQWVTTVQGAMSVCGVIIKPRPDAAGAQAEQAPEARLTPAPAEKKDAALPAKLEASSTAWTGEYCNPKGCLNISDFRQTPESVSFSFAFVLDGKQAGEGTAAVDGRDAGYADLAFSLKMSGRAVQVSKAPGAQPDPKAPWTEGCLGTYMRK